MFTKDISLQSNSTKRRGAWESEIVPRIKDGGQSSTVVVVVPFDFTISPNR